VDCIRKQNLYKEKANPLMRIAVKEKRGQHPQGKKKSSKNVMPEKPAGGGKKGRASRRNEKKVSSVEKTRSNQAPLLPEKGK